MSKAEDVKKAKSEVRDWFASAFNLALDIIVLALTAGIVWYLSDAVPLELFWQKASVFIAVFLIFVVILTPFWILLDLRVLVVDLHDRVVSLEQEIGKAN